MLDLGVALVFVVFFLIIAAICVPILTIWFRQQGVERQRLMLSHHYFTGHPQVVLQPGKWKISVTAIRQLARERGYVEAGRPNPDTLVFQLAQPTPSGGPAYPAPFNASTPTKRQLRRRRQLFAGLASQGIAWVQASQLGLGAVELDHLARGKGFFAARVLGNQADPTVLLSRTPIRSLNDAVDPALKRSLTSKSRVNVHRLMVGTAALFLGVFGALLGADDRSWWLRGGLGAIGLVLLAAGLGLLHAPKLHDTTHRMSLLIREFNGRLQFTLDPTVYLLDRVVIGDVANELGYAYSSSEHGLLGRSRWNWSWITYVRTSSYQPREGAVTAQSTGEDARGHRW